MIKLPRLLDANMAEKARLEPSSLSIELNLKPVSTASMELPESQPAVASGDYIELYNHRGESVGIFRVQQTSQAYGDHITLSLEHGICSLYDSLIPATVEEAKTTTVKEALTEILGYQSMWKLGTVEVPDSTTVTWEYDYSNLMKSLTSVMDVIPNYRLTYDQTKRPWTVNVVKLTSDISSECRLSRNVNSLSIETDRSDLCTRLYVPALEKTFDADTISTWGVVARSLTGDEALSDEDLETYAEQYLDEHKNPAISINIDAVDLHGATGDDMDHFQLGYMCRIALPDYGQTVNERIVGISYPDLVREPGRINLTMSTSVDTTADAIAGLIIDTSVLRSSTGRLYKYYHEGEETAKIHTGLLNEYGQYINEAKIEIDGINATLDLTVRKDNLISAINMSPESIVISSSKVNLRGYVTAEELETNVIKVVEEADLSYVTATHVSAYDFDGVNAYLSNAYISGSLTLDDQPVATQAWVTANFQAKT